MIATSATSQNWKKEKKSWATTNPPQLGHKERKKLSKGEKKRAPPKKKRIFGDLWTTNIIIWPKICHTQKIRKFLFF
jgi:hypothetical protein